MRSIFSKPRKRPTITTVMIGKECRSITLEYAPPEVLKVYYKTEHNPMINSHAVDVYSWSMSFY
jgi:hypothetical protein